MELIDSILAVDWVKYGTAALVAMSGLVTLVDAFVKATPTKADDEALGPYLRAAKSVFARFSYLRGSK